MWRVVEEVIEGFFVIVWCLGLEMGERLGSGRGSGWYVVEMCVGLVGVLYCVFFDVNVRGGVWCC